jgi:hypothetical protein
MASISALIHGKKPEWAPLKILDPLKLLQQLLSGEITEWPQIQQLGDLFQNYMVSGIENLVPAFSDILKEGGVTTESMLQQAAPLIKGEIPEDVKAQVARSAAFKSLMAGSMGGPMGGALTARDLGLTSLDLMQQGANLAGAAGNAAQRWAGLSQGTMMNPQTQLYSPEWFVQLRQQQEAARTANLQMKYNLAAAPDPAWADRAKLLASYGGMALGGGMGGGGGAGSSMNTYGSAFGGQGQNLGFGGNYQSAMYGAAPVGAGGAAGSAWSPWQSGATDVYFPNQQSWNAYQGTPPPSASYNTTPYQYNIAANPWGY